MTYTTEDDKIGGLLSARNWTALREELASMPPALIAILLPDFSKSERVMLFRCIERERAGDVFSFLNDSLQEQLLNELTDQETRDLLAEMSPDDRTALLEELPAPVTQKLLDQLSPEDRKEALTLLGYPEHSVGRLMSPDFAAVREGMSLDQAMAAIKARAADSETLNMIYVTDEKGRLIDDIPLRRFMVATSDQKVSEIMDGHYIALRADESQEDAVRLMKQTGYFALPVTDSQGVMLGIVTADDVLDVAVEESTEDFHKGSAVKPLGMGYLEAPLKMLYARRISWLVILVFMNIFSGAGIAHFEDLIATSVALVFFLPLLIDSGGNAGSQAATLVIRSMALGEVRLTDYLRVMWRELGVAIGLGLTMSLAVFLLAWWRSGMTIALVAGIAMSCIVVLGSLIGMSLPFALRKLGYDPAAASAPLVTSLADISGVLIYLGIASAILGQIE
ncbi:MAG TPA: magnesium transporter [Kiritimatiellia bacterium]|nr:magnesium transporter [Kiritimatiellia bacterium]